MCVCDHRGERELVFVSVGVSNWVSQKKSYLKNEFESKIQFIVPNNFI